VKVIEKRKVLQLQKQAEVFKERKALIMLDHPCIVRMHWSFDVSTISNDDVNSYLIRNFQPVKNGLLLSMIFRIKSTCTLLWTWHPTVSSTVPSRGRPNSPMRKRSSWQQNSF
jgi:hypothetical protein